MADVTKMLKWKVTSDREATYTKRKKEGKRKRSTENERARETSEPPRKSLCTHPNIYMYITKKDRE